MINQYIKLYGKRLYGLCLSLCADRTEADDLYQETWLKVLKNISRFNEDMEFEPWLTKICVNTYRNTLRRMARSPFLNYFSSTEEKENVLNNVASPEKEDYSALYEAINNLPEKLRVVIILFYFRDMDIKVTADILGIPEGTVKSRLNKARKLLKEVLKDETNL